METETEADLVGGEATGGTTAGNLTRAERVAKRLAGLDPMDIPLPPGSQHELVKVGSEDATRYGLEEDKHCVVTKVEDGDGGCLARRVWQEFGCYKTRCEHL